MKSFLNLEFSYRIKDVRLMLYRLRKNFLSIIGLVLVGIILLITALAPFIVPDLESATGEKIDTKNAFLPPSSAHPFGTDNMGRDYLSRVIFGARISIPHGFLIVLLAMVIGIPLGLIAGYYGGLLNSVLMRITDVFLSIPPLLLALAVAAILEPSLTNSVIAISFTWWPWYARLVQGEVLSKKEEEFVMAAKSLGAGNLYIIFKEILPNILSPIIVRATLDIGYAILTLSALGFLGLGARPPTPEWGTLCAAGRAHLPEMWWLPTFPGLAIFITVLAFNLLGDGLRDALQVELQ